VMSDDGIPQAMLLSAVIGKPVVDRGGERVGTVKDLVVVLSEEQHPPVIGLAARVQGRESFIPATWVTELDGRGVHLALNNPDLEPFVRGMGGASSFVSSGPMSAAPRFAAACSRRASPGARRAR
jgi:hypothetical protein